MNSGIHSAQGRVLAQAGFGLACTAAFVLVRTLVDAVVPNSGPFALVYPFALIAVLYGHLIGGVIALVLSFLWAWYYVLPPERSFAWSNPDDPWRLLINFICASVVVIFAEGFRRAVQLSMRQLNEEIDTSNKLRGELEHRTKNNLAMVVSLLEHQARRAASPEVKDGLAKAVMRIRTFADVYSQLIFRRNAVSAVELKPYLTSILDKLQDAVVPSRVKVSSSFDDATFTGEKAVALGLYLNEAVTNIVKHAFNDRQSGTITVNFSGGPDSWSFSISDDGRGIEDRQSDQQGQGHGLMEVFAAQANAVHQVTSSPAGTTLVLTSLVS